MLVLTLDPDTATHYDSYDHEEYKVYGMGTRKVLLVILEVIGNDQAPGDKSDLAVTMSAQLIGQFVYVPQALGLCQSDNEIILTLEW